MNIQPFKIAISQADLDDLLDRLAHTRWPDEGEGAGWDYGTNLQYMKELTDYWQHQYDWRKHEAELNTFAQFKAEIDSVKIHFIHERGKGPNPIPLLLIHGWPDSFYRFHKIIPMLTDPERFGGDPQSSFDVIVPSLPGFGFSDRPGEGGMKSIRSADLLARLMHEGLGYKQFAAAGGDIGSRVVRLMALAHPEWLIGIHLTDIGFPREVAFPPEVTNPSPVEQRFLGSVQGWFFQEGAYAMLYWVTETISSSARLYREDGLQTAPQLKAGQYIEVPAGVATFPKDLTVPPRELGERFLRVKHWTKMPRGGHFAALEEPKLLVEDVRAFFRPLR